MIYLVYLYDNIYLIIENNSLEFKRNVQFRYIFQKYQIGRENNDNYLGI